MSPAGLHRMVYSEWGDAACDRVLVCVHGLARVGSDFDELARAMSDQYRVICPDIAGRGRSDWLADPMQYQFPQYVGDMITLLARVNARTVHWIGTSMGGLIGMALAAQPHTPIKRLILNDVGPILRAEALKRITEFLGQAPDFPDLATALAFIRTVSAPFGLTSDAQWIRLTETSLRPHGSGFRLHYDPAIATPLKAQGTGSVDIDVWPIYEAVTCPTLVVRGELSDMLDRATMDAMARRGPRAQVAEIPAVGHAPMYMDPAQIAVVRNFLLQP